MEQQNKLLTVSIIATMVIVIILSILSLVQSNKTTKAIDSLRSHITETAKLQPTTTPLPTTAPTTLTPTTIAPELEIKSPVSVKIYFGRVTATDSQVTGFNRTADKLTVANFLMEEYFKGPNAQEAAEGYTRNFNVVGENQCTDKSRAAYVDINQKVATVTTCKQIQGIGDTPDLLVVESIVKTLRQFPSVEKVALKNFNGTCVGIDPSGFESIPCEIGAKVIIQK